MYVLRSESSGRRYVGQTDDLHRCLGEHDDPVHYPRKITSRSPGPWAVVHTEDLETWPEAVKRGEWLK